MGSNRQKTLFEAWNPQDRNKDSNAGPFLSPSKLAKHRSTLQRIPEHRELEGARQLDLPINSDCTDNKNPTPNQPPEFDESAGSIWIYPTNQTVRDYQFDIVKTALFQNTLVSLPTGLGKTFIAAVVMYNYYRWFPNDVIVFMAPTRPLVTQQLEACHNIVGIPSTQTVELTGHIPQKKRDELWKSKKVFFLTPQVMASDLNRGACPVKKVRCVVFDEAHKTTGNHAYVQVITTLSKYQNPPFFRVLALSATPGNDLSAVQQVVTKLMISRVEIRSEDSPDLMPYTHQKCVETVVVDLPDYMKEFRRTLLEVFQLYTGKLMKQNVIFGRDGSSFTQFQLLKFRENFRTNPPLNLPIHQKGYVEGDFATSISLAKALELLDIHGLHSCYNFIQGILNRERGSPMVSAEFRRSQGICSMVPEIQKILNIEPKPSRVPKNSSTLYRSFSNAAMEESSHFVPVEGADLTLSHPKMGALKEIVTKHFNSYSSKGQSTRIIIFSKFRDSVEEIGAMLDSLKPLVKPMVFIGQSKSGGGGAGFNQKRQGKVLQQFRDGDFNLLVATSVGEEGLDIGEVDLIICYDACGSPTRLVQRMGRTGRQRQGKIVFLLTEGKEQMTYNSSLSMQKSINKTLTDVTKLQPYLYKNSPRMIPTGVEPVCYKMNIVLSTERDDYGNDVSRKDKKESKAKKRNATATTAKSAPKKSKMEEDVAGPSSKSIPPPMFPKTKEISLQAKVVPEVIVDANEMDVHFGHLDAENPFHENERNLFISELLDIQDSAQTFGPCLYVPSSLSDLHTNIPELDSHSGKMRLSEESSDLRSLREAVEALVLVGSSNGKCACGNSNSHLNELCSMSPVTNNQPTNPNANLSHSEKLINVEKFYRENANPEFVFPDDDPNEKYGYANFDPLDDGDDDWVNEVDWEESIFPSEANSFERNEAGPSSRLQQPSAEADIAKGGANVQGASESEKIARYTRTQMRELFKDDELLFEEDDDYTSSDGSSTGNEERWTPIRRGTHGCQPGGLEGPVRLYMYANNPPDDSSTDSEEMFAGNAAADTSDNNPINIGTFQAGVAMQSTPKKSGLEEYEEDFDDSLSSPDLSQFRMENRMKSSLLPNRDLQTYSKVMSPGNNSAEMLNEYLGSMRRESSQRLSRDQQHSSNSALNQTSLIPAEDISGLKTSSSVRDNSSAKKTFTFKKRVNALRMSTDISSIVEMPSSSSGFLSKTDGSTSKTSLGPKDISTLPNQSDYLGIADRSFGLHTFDPPRAKEGFVEVRKPEPSRPDSTKKSSAIFKGSEKKDYSFAQDAGGRYKQYCSADFINSDFDCNEKDWKHQDVMYRSNEDVGKASVKELIEQKRLQAMKIRHSKMQGGEQHLLQEIKPINCEMPSSKNLSMIYRKKTPSASTVTSPVQKNDQENLPSSSSRKRPALSSMRPKTETNNGLEFSDDDDFIFVKPQRKVSKVNFEESADTSRQSIESQEASQQPLRQKIKKPRNPYVEYEADVSGESSDGNSADEYAEDLDLDDSFVTQNFDETVTYSQQARYVESLKDVLPAVQGRVEKPLSPSGPVYDLNQSQSYYDDGDSFCVPNDECEYLDVGIFTQAMQQAKSDLQKGDGGESRVTRNRQRRKAEEEARGPEKRRRRVYTLEDSSDED